MRQISTKFDNVGDTLPAGLFNTNHSAEMTSPVTTSGMTLDPEVGPDTDNKMLSKAMCMYATAPAHYSDTGAVNTYVLSRSGQAGQELTALDIPYKDGQFVIFKATTTNTGASTINVQSQGSKSLTLPDGSALSAAAIVAGHFVLCRFNYFDDRFELLFNSAPELPAGYISGLLISKNGDYGIDFASGAACGSNLKIPINLKTLITKNLNIAWAEGTGVGGLFTGSTFAANTWYSCYAILKNDGTVDAGFNEMDLSVSLPANYIAYRRVGYIKTDGASIIRNFQSFFTSNSGLEFLWKDAPQEIFVSGLIARLSPVTYTLSFLPPKTNGKFSCLFIGGATTGPEKYLTFNSVGNTTPPSQRTTYAYSLYGAQITGGSQFFYLYINENTQIVYEFEHNGAGATVDVDAMRLTTWGWIDPRVD